MWLYVVSSHWVKAVYLCFFLTPAISPCTPLGLQIKEGSLWTKQKVWQGFGHLRRTKPCCCSGSRKQRLRRVGQTVRLRERWKGTASLWSPTRLDQRLSHFMSFFWCLLKKGSRGFVISLWQQQRPMLNDIYIHIQSVCCQRWCDSFSDWGVAMGTWLNKSSCFTCGRLHGGSWKLLQAPFVCQPAVLDLGFQYHLTLEAWKNRMKQNEIK